MTNSINDADEDAPSRNVVSFGHHLAPTPIETPREELGMLRSDPEMQNEASNSDVVRSIDRTNAESNVDTSVGINATMADSASGGREPSGPLSDFHFETTALSPDEQFSEHEVRVQKQNSPGGSRPPLAETTFDALSARLLRRLRAEQSAAQFRARANSVE